MKTLIVLLLTLGCCCCSRQKDYNTVLTQADDVMEQDADSAYTLLQQIPDIMDNGDQASMTYYQLLTAQACYKLYKPVPPDSVLQDVVNYYKQCGNRPYLCRALYYQSMILYEQGRHDEALLRLKEGEELALALNDVSLLSKYHESLCMVNYKAGGYALMLEYAKLFLDDAIKQKDTALISRAYSHVSTAYTRLGQHDKARSYIIQILPILHQTDDSIKASILTNIGCTYHRDGQTDSAKYYLNRSLQIHPRANTYAELGDIYFQEGNIQQADKCWGQALLSSNPLIVMNTLETMSEHYKRMNDDRHALLLTERIMHIKDSLYTASEQAKIEEIQKRHDKQVVEKRYYKALTWLLGISLLGIILSFAYYVYYRHTIRKYNSKLDERQRIINEARQQVKVLQDSGQEHYKEISDLQQQIKDIRREAFEEIGHGREVFNSVTDNRPIQYHEDEERLIEYFSVFHYDTYHHWMLSYRELSLRLITILILQDMGKTDAEMSQILCISNGAIRTAKSRLKSKRKR